MNQSRATILNDFLDTVNEKDVNTIICVAAKTDAEGEIEINREDGTVLVVAMEADHVKNVVKPLATLLLQQLSLFDQETFEIGVPGLGSITAHVGSPVRMVDEEEGD